MAVTGQPFKISFGLPICGDNAMSTFCYSSCDNPFSGAGVGQAIFSFVANPACETAAMQGVSAAMVRFTVAGAGLRCRLGSSRGNRVEPVSSWPPLLTQRRWRQEDLGPVAAISSGPSKARRPVHDRGRLEISRRRSRDRLARQEDPSMATRTPFDDADCRRRSGVDISYPTGDCCAPAPRVSGSSGPSRGPGAVHCNRGRSHRC
jgi:hypothetical protein